MERVWVLYEDKLGDVKEFGPHALVRQYVCDALGKNRWEVPEQLLKGDPKNGNGNVLKACKKDLGRLVKGGYTVVAVYDSDKIGELVGLPRTACKTQLVARLKDGCEPADRLVVVLLDENIEAVVRAVAECDPSLADAEDLRLSIERKDRNCRDKVLTRAASPPARATRDQIAARVPSLGYLVRRIVGVLRRPT